MAPLNLSSSEGLLTTRIHGMSQDLFVVTEDRVNNFNNYSTELQFCSAAFFTFLGLFLGNLNNTKSVIFGASLALSIFFLVATIWQYRKFSKAKSLLFIKNTDITPPTDAIPPLLT